MNVKLDAHANLQIVDLSTKVSIGAGAGSHSEEVLFTEQAKNAYMANPSAFMS